MTNGSSGSFASQGEDKPVSQLKHSLCLIQCEIAVVQTHTQNHMFMSVCKPCACASKYLTEFIVDNLRRGELTLCFTLWQKQVLVRLSVFPIQ